MISDKLEIKIPRLSKEKAPAQKQAEATPEQQYPIEELTTNTGKNIG